MKGFAWQNCERSDLVHTSCLLHRFTGRRKMQAVQTASKPLRVHHHQLQAGLCSVCSASVHFLRPSTHWRRPPLTVSSSLPRPPTVPPSPLSADDLAVCLRKKTKAIRKELQMPATIFTGLLISEPRCSFFLSTNSDGVPCSHLTSFLHPSHPSCLLADTPQTTPPSSWWVTSSLICIILIDTFPVLKE